MSAYHHVREGAAYPAVLLTTGINDPRVEPRLHAKMAARLQAATSSGRPVLLRVDYEGGHGVGLTRRQFAEEITDFMTFLLCPSSATRPSARGRKRQTAVDACPPPSGYPEQAPLRASSG